MHGPIVVGTDGSETAAKALAVAIDMAAKYSQELHVISAYRPLTRVASVPAEFADVVTPMSKVESVLADAASRARAAGVKVTTTAVQGDPADALLDTAEKIGADTIIVGNKGIGSVKRFVLGNVPAKIVHNSPCSTYIVHTT